MRVAGSLLLVVCVLFGFGLWLWPAHVTVLGTTAACDPPIRVVLGSQQIVSDQLTADILNECRAESIPRVLLGLVVVLIGGGAAGVMLTERAAGARP
jgi:hypothetical protein